VNRGERLIKFRDSWFSVKPIEVGGWGKNDGGRALIRRGGVTPYRTVVNSKVHFNLNHYSDHGREGSLVKRERAQINN